MFSWLDANAITIVNGVALAALLFLIAVGLSLVFGTMDVLNLAHGSIALSGAYIGVGLMGVGATIWHLGLAIAAAAALGLGAGLMLSTMTSKISDHLRQALLTLGIALIAGDILRELFGSDVQSVGPPSELASSVKVFGDPYPVYRLVMIAVGAFVALALYLLLERTKAGAVIRATVADRPMVESMGLRTDVILGGVFAGGAALAAIGGLLAAPILGAQPGLDDTVLLLALVVVVTGGLGSVRGALLGALVVGQAQTLGVALFPEYAPFLLFAAMAAVLLVRPRGLLPATTGAHA